MTKHIKNVLSALLFMLLGVVLMVWIYRGFDFAPLVKMFKVRDNYYWITLSLLAGVLANVLRAFRWRMLLAGAGIALRRRRTVELVFISYLINSVTPRLGELTRSLLVRRGDVAVSTKAFGTVIVEKLADVSCLILVVLASVCLRWEDTLGLLHKLWMALNAAVSSYTLYIIVGVIVCVVLGVALPKISQLHLLFHHLWKGMAAIVRLSSPSAFALLCAGIWTCNFLQIYLLLPCFPELSMFALADALYLFAAASVGVLLPTPGGAGPWHFAIVKTLTGIYGVQAPVAKLFALVTHGLKTALVMLLGILAYVTFYWEVIAKALKRRKR